MLYNNRQRRVKEILQNYPDIQHDMNEFGSLTFDLKSISEGECVEFEFEGMGYYEIREPDFLEIQINILQICRDLLKEYPDAEVIQNHTTIKILLPGMTEYESGGYLK